MKSAASRIQVPFRMLMASVDYCMLSLGPGAMAASLSSKRRRSLSMDGSAARREGGAMSEFRAGDACFLPDGRPVA